MKWARTKIGEIKSPSKKSLVGGPFGSDLSGKHYVDEGVPVIRGGNLPFDRMFHDEEFVFVSEEKAEDLSANLAYPGDVIFTQRGTLGQVGIIPENSIYPRYLISQSQMKLTPDQNKVNPRFVYYFFRHPNTIQNVKNHAITSGVPHINLGILREFEIPLPPLSNQNRIVSILSAYDDLIENNRRRIALLEESARLLYREWFVRLRFPGHEHTSIINGVPEGWTRVPLAEVADFRLGKMLDQAKNKGEMKPYLANINVRWGEVDLAGLREMRFQEDEQETFGLRYGDIVMCEGGEPGRCAIWKDQLPGMMFQKAIHRIRSRENMDYVYLYYNLRHQGESGQLAGLFTGATIKHFPREKLAKVTVLLPAKGLMDLFAEHARPIEKQIGILEASNRQSSKARDLLLPKLMNGEIEV